MQIKPNLLYFLLLGNELTAYPVKLSAKILSPNKSVKYLGVHLDKHLNWKARTASVAIKLRRLTGLSPNFVTLSQLSCWSTSIMPLLYPICVMLVKFGLYVILALQNTALTFNVL